MFLGRVTGSVWSTVKWPAAKGLKLLLVRPYQLGDLPSTLAGVASLSTPLDDLVVCADLLDAGVIFGTGFAPFRGGPIQYIRSVGADKLKLKLEQLSTRYGSRFSPRPGWDAL